MQISKKFLIPPNTNKGEKGESEPVKEWKINIHLCFTEYVATLVFQDRNRI